LPEGEKLGAQVVVVGAGPAGIVTALELAGHGVDVLLLDSGGWDHDPDLEELSAANVRDANRHVPLSIATQRRVGGTSGIWGGRCVPYDPVDFDERAFAADGAWPISYEDMSAYYGRACSYFRCGQPVFDAMQIPSLAGRTLAPGLINGEVRASDLERWSLPTRFGSEYGRALRAHPRLTMLTGSTCVEVVSEPSGSAVSHLRCVNRAGREMRVRGQHYVLHPGGIGNHSGHLGRWYMAHVDGRIAKVRFAGDPDATIYSHERDDDGVYVRRRLSFSREAQHAHELPNVVAWTVNPDLFDASHGSGVLSFAYLALTSPVGDRFAPDAIRRAMLTGSASSRASHVRNVVRSPLATAWFAIRFGYQRFLARRKAPGFFVKTADNTYPLHYHGEHLPNPDSRVSLTQERDGVGMRRLDIDIRFSEQDARGIVRAHELWDKSLRQSGAGHLIFDDGDLVQRVAEQTEGGFHQIGTTRMAARAQDGVLAPDLMVHGVDNLSVVSSSAFCSSGQANSTFLVVAFALRCSDGLWRRLAHRETLTPP
jgi:choline dehydrogenase-like flavoprotein